MVQFAAWKLACLTAFGCSLLLCAPPAEIPLEESPKPIVPIPATVPPGFPSTDSLASICRWIKARQRELSPNQGDDVSVVAPVASVLPESEWLHLLERADVDLGSNEADKVAGALRMCHILIDASRHLPALNAPLALRIFPTASAQLDKARPEHARMLAGVVSALVPVADPEKIIPTLIEMSRSENPLLRRQGIGGFERAIDSGHAGVLLTDAQRTQIANALVDRFSDTEVDIREMSIALIGHTGTAASIYVPPLTLILSSNESTDRMRMAALRAIADFGAAASQATPSLIELLKFPNRRVQRQACVAIAAIGVPARDAVPGLVQLLSGDDIELQVASAKALGVMKESAAAALPKLDALAKQDLSPSATNAFAIAAQQIRQAHKCGD